MTANPNGQRMPRPERYLQVRALREQGLRYREIAEQTGISISTVHAVLSDPSGEKARRRKQRYERPCVDCGITINPNGLTRGTVRCIPCNGAHERALSRRWIVESMQEWARKFGAPPSSVDWNPAMARRKASIAWKADRYEATGRPWPSSTSVQKNFESWNNGLRAAGFEPLTPSEHWLGHAGVALQREDQAA